MKVKDLMQTDIATLRPGDALDIAEDIMGMGRIRHLPVVQANGRLVGIVSQRDLLKASISSVIQAPPYKQQKWLSKVPVRDVMSKSVVAVEAEADVEDAVNTLLIEKFGCLPVVEDKKLVGMLTETDLLRHLQSVLQQTKTKTSKKKTKVSRS